MFKCAELCFCNPLVERFFRSRFVIAQLGLGIGKSSAINRKSEGESQRTA